LLKTQLTTGEALMTNFLTRLTAISNNAASAKNTGTKHTMRPLGKGETMAESQHGGKREGAGRRYLNGSDPHEGNPARRITVTVTQDTLEELEKLGDGNVSKGVRKAAEYSKEATMENVYDWNGPGWYASRGEGRNRTLTTKVNMDGGILSQTCLQ
jgi:hypothetical protein